MNTMHYGLLAVGIVFGLACTPSDSGRITQDSDIPFSYLVTPIARTFRGSAATSTDTSRFSTGSYTPAANRILIATVQNTKSGSATAVNSFSGNGLTWNMIQTVVDNGGTRRITQYWTGTGASPTTGAATADFNSVSQTSAHIRVDEFDGLNLTNPIGDTNTKSPSGSATSMALALTFSSTSNGTYAAISNNGSAASTPTAANITQMSAVNLNTPSSWLMTGWDAGNQTAPAWSTTSSWGWWGAGFEMVAATPAHPNEPAGYIQLTERDFASTSEDGWTTTGSANFSIDTTQTDMTRTTVASGRARYTTSHNPGSGPFTIEKTFTASTEMYLDWDLKISSNWYGHDSSGVNKILFLAAGTETATPGYVAAFGAGNNNLQLQFRLQSCPTNVGGNNQGGARNVPIRSITRGTKYRIEMRFVMNSVDESGNAVADGIFEAWVDGVLEVADSGMAYRGGDGLIGPNQKWNRVRWNGTYGGNGGSSPPAEQYMWIGYLYGSQN